jgi:hypothetical protein
LRSADSVTVRQAERMVAGSFSSGRYCPVRRLVAMLWNAAVIFCRSVLNRSGAYGSFESGCCGSFIAGMIPRYSE